MRKATARRAFIAATATLGLIGFLGLFPVFSGPLSLGNLAYLQSNSPPQFTTGDITREAEENTPWFDAIGSPVEATDADNDTLSYSLANAGTSHFTIDRSTGQPRTGAPLNYEAKSSYTVEVSASDPSGASASASLTINVTNVDEPGRVSLSWKQPQVDTEITASLTDPDGGVSGETWQWAKANNSNGNYSDISGATSASYTPSTGDIGDHLKATVSYTDTEGQGKTADAVSSRNVRAVPSSNNAPSFPAADDISNGYDCPGTDPERGACMYVRRSSPVGAELYNPVRAQDQDGDDLRYSLEGDDIASFGIDPKTARLFTKQLVRDVGNVTYAVTMRATDPSGASDTIGVTVTPSGSRGVPVVEGPREIEYPENGTWRVASYTAESGHGPSGGWIISVQPGGGDGDYFDIDDDGVLTFRNPPNYEVPDDEHGSNTYSFSIMAYDSNPPNGKRPGQTFFPVKVTVVDLQEEPEIAGLARIDHDENEQGPVGTYLVTGVENSQVTWSVSGDDGDDLSISSAGALTFNAPPNYERPADADGNNAYLVTVQALVESKTLTLPVAIMVADVEEAPAFPSSETGARSVRENTAAGVNIGRPVAAVDDDGDSLTYTLSGTDAGSFDIVEPSGQLQTRDPLDYDTKSSYTVTVSVTDGNDARGNPNSATDDTITVTISVTKADGPPNPQPTQSGGRVSSVPPPEPNRAPAFSEGNSAQRNVPEGTAPGTNIGLPLQASDANGDALTYTLEGTDAASFAIVGTSGQLKTKDPLDYETKSSYTLTVEVTDPSGASDTITVTIDVTDLEEAPAFPASETGARSVAENTAAGENIGDPVTAVDDDGDSLTYILSGDDAESFDIVESSGQLQTKSALDYDTRNSYTLTVSVADGNDAGGNPDSTIDDTISVTISVTKVDRSSSQGSSKREGRRYSEPTPVPNRAPQFSEGDETDRTVAEGVDAGTNIGQPLGAVDADRDALTYTLEGTDASSFDLDGSSGQLKTKADLDHETKASYTVVVKVTDPSNASDSITVTVTVADVEETPAFPSNESGSRMVPENTEAGENIGDPVAANDDDNDSLTYILSGDDAESFDIVESSGQLKTKAELDYESKSTYTLTVLVRDGYDSEGSPNTATDDSITVTISVTNVEEAPAFPASETGARSVAENTAEGENIAAPIAAADDDGDSLTYSLGGVDAGVFDIVETSGQLQTKDALDYETRSGYTMTVSVHDGKDASGNSDTSTDDTIEVTVTVTNVDEEGAVGLLPVQPQVDSWLRASITDPDRGIYITTWLWERSADQSSWESIDGASGASYKPVTGDLGQYLRVSVTYSDSEGSGKSAQVESDNSVKAAPVSNSAPAFDAETATRDIAENTDPGENIGDPVVAQDDDNDTLTYTLGGVDAESFDIVASSGQLQTKGSLDYETDSTYIVTVTATDPSNVSDSVTVTITVTNVEEAPAEPVTAVPETEETDEVGTGDDPVTSFIVSFPWGEAFAPPVPGNGGESGPSRGQTIPIQGANAKEFPAIWLAVILMAVGASMIAFGMYLLTGRPQPHRWPWRQSILGVAASLMGMATYYLAKLYRTRRQAEEERRAALSPALAAGASLLR